MHVYTSFNCFHAGSHLSCVQTTSSKNKFNRISFGLSVHLHQLTALRIGSKLHEVVYNTLKGQTISNLCGSTSISRPLAWGMYFGFCTDHVPLFLREFTYYFLYRFVPIPPWPSLKPYQATL